MARPAPCCAAKPSTPRISPPGTACAPKVCSPPSPPAGVVPPKYPANAELARLGLENERITRKLAVAETIIDVQKISALLGITLGRLEQGGRG